MARGSFKSDEACREWWGKVSSVAQLFERRWTELALRRVDPELAQRLHEQRALFDDACLRGTVADIELQGGGMVRGWLAAIRTMEEAGEADSAYLMGTDPVSGLKIAIGHQKAAAGRVVELYGQDAVHVTPDEVATLLAGLSSFQSIGAVKKMFPGAEIVQRYEGEGT